MNYRCYASCAFGIDGILAGELRTLGFQNVAARYFSAHGRPGLSDIEGISGGHFRGVV